MIKWMLIIGFVLVLSTGFSQQYGSKDFYLLDSLDLEKLTDSDRHLLDSCLTLYHGAKQDTAQLGACISIAENCKDRHVGALYNELAFTKLQLLTTEKNRSLEELKKIFEMIQLCYSLRGYNAQEDGRIKVALDNYYKALKIAESMGDRSSTARVRINLSGVYYYMGDLIRAKEMNVEAQKCLDGLDGNEENQLFIYNNLAVLAKDAGDYDEAIALHQKSLELCELTANEFGKGTAYNNLGGLYKDMDSFNLAIINFEKAERIFRELENDMWLSLTYYKMGRAYFDKGDTEKGLEYAQTSYQFAVASNKMMPKVKASYLLYSIYDKLENYKDALYFYQKHEYWNDSVTSQENKMAGFEKDFIYKSNREKAIAKKENERKWEIARVDQERKEAITYAIFCGLILVIIFVIILYFRLRIITRQKEVIEKQSHERKLLLQEIHHRVKNNFQIVSSVLKLQAVEENNAIIDQAFDDAINRIHSMATVHEMIYKQDNFSAISPKDYFLRLTDSMRTYSVDKQIEFEVESDVKTLNVRTLIPLGISVNELITNSIKYAFGEKTNVPKIKIKLKQQGQRYILSYLDNGVGIGDEGTHSFGMELIKTIIEQIDGQLETLDDTNWSTHLRISFA